jgi:hypothetical protein
MTRVVDLYPLRGRILSWILWKTPLRIISRRFGRSPYGRIVAICSPIEASRVTRKADPLTESVTREAGPRITDPAHSVREPSGEERGDGDDSSRG